MKCKIYATDEGFGPLVRQGQIADHMRALKSGVHIEVQCERHIDSVPAFFGDVSLIKKNNLIEWAKNVDGSPNLQAIRRRLSLYGAHSEAYIAREMESSDFDFSISDFVYEAFEVAANLGKPSFGVCHFTWDWFFGKLYPSVLPMDLANRFRRQAQSASRLYFPAYTPTEIVRSFDNAVSTPLVVRTSSSQAPPGLSDSACNVLLVDSGSGVLRKRMRALLKALAGIHQFRIFTRSQIVGDLRSDNIVALPDEALLVDYIGHVDFVIARAGFNTISECIGHRTPMLLLAEGNNPELLENVLFVERERFGAFIDLQVLSDQPAGVLSRFLEYEFPGLEQVMKNHDISTDGARFIAEDILNFVGA